MTLSSRTNPKIKLARSLYRAKARRENALFLAEGIHLVGEALESSAPIHSILYSVELLRSTYANELVDLAQKKGIPCYATTASAFDSIAAKENPQGILAIVHQEQYKLHDLYPGNFSFGVALISPQDPGNIGTILRTIDAVGADGLLLVGGGADPYHHSAVRASMGTIFWHPLVQLSLQDFSDWVQQHKYNLYATSAHGDLPHHEMRQYQPPLILLMGSERQGLPQELASRAHSLIRLPMMGRATSLNLAVATGVILYDIFMKSEQGLNFKTGPGTPGN